MPPPLMPGIWVMAKSTMYCIAMVAIARYRLLTRKRGEAEDHADHRAGDPAREHRDFQRSAEAHQMHAGISADRHHRAIAEMDLAGAAHQKIEPERGRRPDQPGQQIGDEIKPVDDERRRQRQRDDDADQQPIERQRP